MVVSLGSRKLARFGLGHVENAEVRVPESDWMASKHALHSLLQDTVSLGYFLKKRKMLSPSLGMLRVLLFPLPFSYFPNQRFFRNTLMGMSL